jgi:hypothetical protein
MAKFYVQSGTFRRVVAADSCRKAALWAVHEVMQQVLPIEDSNVSRLGNTSNDAESVQKITVLSGKVRVDERGFDRIDAKELPTIEVVAEWNQMVMTLDRLQQMLDGTCNKTPVPAERFNDDDFSEDRFSDDLAA